LHVGLDRSIGLLQQCIAQSPGRELCLGSALALPYRDACTDAVMSIAVVHHFSTRERRVDAVREMARVVRPGGPILITVWAWEQEKFKNELSQDLFVQWQNSEDGVTYQRYYHLFAKNELEAVCADVETVELVNSYYDTDNWVVVLRRKL
jgi:tRNA (uracil-5-)-methyltransferase TRM9